MAKENKQEQARPNIGIISQYIKDLSMEIPHAPQVFKKMQADSPKIGVEFNIEAGKLEEEGLFNVTLNVSINGDLSDEKAFILELAYGSVVALQGVMPEHIEPVLMVEIPHMLFPYVRQVVSTTMAGAGLPPLMLNPIDFAGMYAARKANEASVSKDSKK
ncbi:MAG: protein-export chaperone SecB [Alphaproteobacteria bacterium]|nr:protein-export chaperone SecB [Alphaproteobacteria bacterium]